MVNLVQFALYTGSAYKHGHITGSDLLYGLIILIIMFSSPFIYAYYRDKREKQRRKRERESKNRS